MDAEDLAGFIVHNRLAWRIWMKGYESGLAQGHQDERTGMDNLADLIARLSAVVPALGEMHPRRSVRNADAIR